MSRGIGGTSLHASLAYLAPDMWNAGVFYDIDKRWTVGIVAQRLVQERSVDVRRRPAGTPRFVSSQFDKSITSVSFGPYAQFRLLPERNGWPSLAVAAYALEWGSVTSSSTRFHGVDSDLRSDSSVVQGDEADIYRSVYVSSSKRIALGRRGVFRALRLYGGAGYGMRIGKRLSSNGIQIVRKRVTKGRFIGWAGGSLELPKNLAAYGEIFTGDECEGGYAVGLRWKSPFGITFTLGVSSCFAAVPQRSLLLEDTVGGQGTSEVSGGSSADGGGLGSLGSLDDD